jgi:hypothetical protein
MDVWHVYMCAVDMDVWHVYMCDVYMYVWHVYMCAVYMTFVCMTCVHVCCLEPGTSWLQSECSTNELMGNPH